jgi:hypothetical protein
MAGKCDRWKKAYEGALQESDPTKQLTLCRRARRLMQHRLVELAPTGNVPERDALEEALRAVWELENRIAERGESGDWVH